MPNNKLQVVRESLMMSKAELARKAGLSTLTIPGDCNQDMRLNIADAICALDILFRAAPLPCDDDPRSSANLAVLDWNGDTSLNLADALSVLNFLFRAAEGHVLGNLCTLVPACVDTCDPAL